MYYTSIVTSTALVFHWSCHLPFQVPIHQVSKSPSDHVSKTNHVSPNKGNGMVVGRPHIRFQTIIPQCTLGGPSNPHYA